MEFMPEGYIIFLVCVFGLCFGSFFNVLILRSISGESIVYPSSKCPKCGKTLKPWHNIPVLSYIFLRGKCAFCKEHISIQYPIVELLTMALFLLCYLRFGFDLKTLMAVYICSSLIIMSGTDIKEKLVDCNIAIILGIAGLIYNYFIGGNIIGALLGVAAGVLIMELIANAGRLFVKTRAFGEADTFVAAALGACFGLRGLLLILLYTLVVSMAYMVPVFLYKQYKADNKLVCIMSIVFILSALTVKTLVQSYFAICLVMISGIGLAWLILKDLRTKSDEKNFTYFPLVPFLAAGALYYLLF